MRDDRRNEPTGGPVFTPPRRRRGSGTSGGDGDGSGSQWIVGIVIVVILVGGAWWGWSFFMDDPEPPAPLPVDTTAVAQPTPTPEGVVDQEPFEGLPSLAESDEWLREEAAELSPDPVWPTWLGSDGLIERSVLGVVNVAAGESPAAQLPFLQPSDTFAVVVEGDRTYADPENGRRYDALVRAVTSLDARATARFYRGVGPLFEGALQQLGFVDREFDEFARSALDVVLSAEVPDGPLEVEQDGIVWAYADPELESLSPATKHLLRLGPENLARLQDWARSFADASGLSAGTGR